MPQLVVDADIAPDRVAELGHAMGFTAALTPGNHESRRGLAKELIADCRAMLCTFLPDNHASMESLGLVQLCSSGFSQVENLGLARRGVRVCNASGVNDVPIAEWAVMMMVALARDLPTMLRNQQQGLWDRGARFQTEIRGRTLGIWGYGGLGQETARLARAMGLRVHVLTRTGRLGDSRPRFRVAGTGDPEGTLADQVFSTDELKPFCASLDFLLLAIPQTPQNVGIVNRQVLEWLPRHACLLNPARGPLVDEAALLESLRTGVIAGAALDAHFQYPMPPEHPLWRMPNIIMTPHIAGSSKSPHFASRLWQLFCENTRRWKSGEPLLNELSAQQLEPSGC